MCTRGLLMAEWFASNACECILRMIPKSPVKYVLDAVTFPVAITNETHRPSTKRP